MIHKFASYAIAGPQYVSIAHWPGSPADRAQAPEPLDSSSLITDPLIRLDLYISIDDSFCAKILF